MDPTKSVLLICCVPEQEEKTIFDLCVSFLKGPYESCELLFSCRDSPSYTFGFFGKRPHFSNNKNYQGKTDKQKEIRVLELDLSSEERVDLFNLCEEASRTYRLSDKAAFETVLPRKPFLRLFDWLLDSIEQYPKDHVNSKSSILHCCSTMVAALLNKATKGRFCNNDKDFSAFKLCTSDVVRLCMLNLHGTFTERMDIYKPIKEKKKKQSLNNNDNNFRVLATV